MSAGSRRSPGSRGVEPRLAGWLVRCIVPGPCGVEMVDDLRADFFETAPRGGLRARAAATFRVWRQVINLDTLRLGRAVRRQRSTPASAPTGGQRGSSWEPLRHDGRQSLRMLRQHPRFVVPAVAIIALGIAFASSAATRRSSGRSFVSTI